ncbi:MAG TPA: hypothetical protein VF816_11250 [Rhodocyclaceae bacterium]
MTCNAMRKGLAVLLGTLAWLASPCQAGDQASMRQPAVFNVTERVLQPNVGPFSAVTLMVGNSMMPRGGGFEPVIFRNLIYTTEGSPDRIIAAPDTISGFDIFREGSFLDDASVRVYRIENGAFRLAREDRVAPGGFHASGWIPVTGGGQVVPPTSTRFLYRWNTWNNPRARYYFAVRAVDSAGNLSAPSNTVAVMRPDKVGDGKLPEQSVPFRPTRTGRVLGSIFGNSGGVQPPRNLRGRVLPDGALSLEWDAQSDPGLAGYVVLRSDYPPEDQRGYYIQLARKDVPPDARLKAGDMVFIGKSFTAFSRNRYLSNRVWGAYTEFKNFLPGLMDFFPDENPNITWELVPHDPASPVADRGSTFLRLTIADGSKQRIGAYNYSGTGQTVYEVFEDKTYRIEAWLRKEGSGTVQFKASGPYMQIVSPPALAVGREWKKFSFDFRPHPVYQGNVAGSMSIEFSGPGTLDIDNFRVYRADAPFMDLLPEDLEELRAAHLEGIRYHGTIGWAHQDAGFRSYDLDQLTNPPGAISGTLKGISLPQILAISERAAVVPWLQIKFNFSEKEWQGLVEYLAAPYDPRRDTPQSKPWAYKRYSQGRHQPWTDAFEKIRLELSNETWNGIFSPWNFQPMSDAATGKRYGAGEVYGMFQEYVRAAMTRSPYWTSAGLARKLEFVLGGWANQVAYGRDAAVLSPGSNLVAIAGYNGGWDVGEGPAQQTPENYFRVLTDAPQDTLQGALRFAREVQTATAGHRPAAIGLGIYEAGPGYALNGLNGQRVTKEQAAEQERVMKSLAAGTATLDAFLGRAALGYREQNFFTFGRFGGEWTSHAKWSNGGQAYPSWKALSLYNRNAAGDFLAVETKSVPTMDLPAYKRREPMRDAPLVAAYATLHGNRLCVFVLSRKMPGYPLAGDDGYTPVTLELPIAGANSVTLYRMAGDPRANNVTSDEVRVETIALPAGHAGPRLVVNADTGADRRGLPPASTFLYVFDGISGLKHPRAR